MRGINEIAGVFDIECADWDRFVCGAIVHADGTKVVHWDEDDFAIALLDCEGVYYAHFGGKYDLIWLADYCIRHQICISDIKPRGSGIMSMKIDALECRDSFALVPMALAKCAPIGNERKSSLALPCECGEECGGYCVLSRRLSSRERAIVTEYIVQDCVATLAMLRGLATRCAEYGISAGLTVGGTAWTTAKEWCDLPKCQHDLGRYDAIRRGYSGGRTEVIRPRAPIGERYDIHSSYPAALSRIALPIGAPTHRKGRAAGQAYRAGHAGVYRARVVVPESYLPPLPAREGDRLLYPHGPIDGVWTGLELSHAESCGARIDKIVWCYSWSTSLPILKPYADRIWAIRDENARACVCVPDAKGKKPGCQWCAFAAWVKWCANSLTGKCAQSPDHETLTFIPAIDGPPILTRDAQVIATNDFGAWVVVESRRVDACAHVEWSAYLTAEARTELHRQLMHAESIGEPLYCDTDSVYSTTALTRRIGPDLGEWGHEGSLTDWHALAPKVYRYRDPSTGKINVRGKGMSDLTSDGFDALSRGEKWIVSRGVDGIKTSLRSHSSELFKRKNLSRSLSPFPGWIGGRVIDGERTRACTVEEYRGRKET